MESLNINIESTPPSIEELGDVRRQAVEQASRAVINERRFNRGVYGAGIALILILLALFGSGVVPGVSMFGPVPVPVAVFVGVLVFALVFASISRVYNFWIEAPRAQADAILASLRELNSEDDEVLDACIAYSKLCVEHEMLAAYQRRIRVMGRRPVMAEYEAARYRATTINEQLSRDEKRKRAREACERIATV